MKIVHLCSMDFGGAGKAAYRLHKGLQEIGVDSSMVVMCKKTSDDSVYALPSEVSNSPEKWWGLLTNIWEKSLTGYPLRPTDNELFSEFYAAISLEPLHEIIRSADIINLHWVAGFFNASLMPSYLLNKKIVWTLHDMNPFTGGCHYAGECIRYHDSCGACPQLASDDPKDISFSGWVLKQQGYLNLDITVVTPSRWLGICSEKSSLLGRFSHKIIPYGFPLSTFKPLDRQGIRSALNIPPDAQIVLFCADSTATKRKGFSYLLDALAQLFESGRGKNLTLAVVGSYDSNRQDACAYPVLSFGHIGDEEQMALLYNAADVFVLPSLEDNLPNTVVEALACGTPVAAFNIGGVPDMVTHGITGYLAPSKDVAGLADAIEWCVNYAPAKIRHSCRAKAEGYFPLETQANNYKKLYESITAKAENQMPGVFIKKTAPKISIVTPSFNQAEYLEECIETILSQNYPNLEYIIMDGGSTDGSVEIIKKYEKYFTYWQSQPDGGQYQAINEGFRRSTGEIMAWLNSDDKYHPGALHLVELAFRAMPQAEWITGRPTAWDNRGKLTTVFDHVPLWSQERLLFHGKDDYYIQQESTFWRRALWDRAGGKLDTTWQLSADFELWCRFFGYSPLVGVDALLGGFRYHSGQKTETMMERYEQEVLQIIARERRLDDNQGSQSRPPAVVPIGKVISVITPELTSDAFSYFSYSRRPHFDWFETSAKKLFGTGVHPDDCDLKMYQDLLCYTFIVDNLPKGARLLEVGGCDSRVLKALKYDYECWNVDKLEGLGNGLTSVTPDGYRMIQAYMGDFSEELPDGYFDFVFSISALEHVAENEENFNNICRDMDRVMKLGAFSLHCFDVVVKPDSVWTNLLLPFLYNRYETLTRFIPFDQMVKDPSLYCMSEAAYNRGWINITKEPYNDFGQPLSCNILWKKEAVLSDPINSELQSLVPDLKGLINKYYTENKGCIAASDAELLLSALNNPLDFLHGIQGPLYANTHSGKLVKQIMLSSLGKAIRKSLPKFRPYCLNYFPQMMINILSDGTVTTCCFDAFGDNRFGSIYEKQLSKIWKDDLPCVMQGDFYEYKRCLQCVGLQGWAPLVNEKGKREEWLEWAHKTPNEIQIEITSSCNYACITCPSSALRQLRDAYLDLDVTFNNLRSMLKKIHKLNLYNYGESLLHKGFSQFVNRCRTESEELILELASNGMLLDNEMSTALIESKVNRLIISVHGGPGTENMLKYASRGADYEKVLENIRHLVQLRNKLGATLPKISLRAILFNWNHNDEDMERFRRDAKKLGLSATWGHYDTDNYHWILDSGAQFASKRFYSGSDALKALIDSREFFSPELYKLEQNHPISVAGTSIRKDIVVATSIAPNNIESQREAIASWFRVGLSVKSVNTAPEIALLKEHFPGVHFIEAKRDARLVMGRPLIFLDDVLAALAMSEANICGIINSDIHLVADNQFHNLILEAARNACVFGHRVDVESLAKQEGVFYQNGFDFFFFDKKLCALFPPTELCLGATWWDIWFPLFLLLKNISLKRLLKPVAYHVLHENRWDENEWNANCFRVISAIERLDFDRPFHKDLLLELNGNIHKKDYLGFFGTLQSFIFNASMTIHSDNDANCEMHKTTISVNKTARHETPYLVTALVSTYNSSILLGACLTDLLAQTLYQNDQLEIIVIDSGSLENEGAIVAEYQKCYQHIRYIRTERETVYGAWNRGIAVAKGKYITNANTDDAHRADALGLMAEAMEQHPEADLAYCNWRWTDIPNDTFANPYFLKECNFPPYDPAVATLYCPLGPHPLWRRSLFERIGPFDASLKAVGDYDFLFRFIVAKCKAVLVPEVLSLFYVNKQGLSRNEDFSEVEVRFLYEQYHANMPVESLFSLDVTDSAAVAAAWICMGVFASRFLVPWEDYELSNPEYAAKCFRKALAMDQGNAIAIHNLIAVLSKLRNWHECEQLIATYDGKITEETKIAIREKSPVGIIEVPLLRPAVDPIVYPEAVSPLPPRPVFPVIYGDGFYEDEHGKRWAAPTAALTIHVDGSTEISMLLTCHEPACYDVFPFEMVILSGDGFQQLVQFTSDKTSVYLNLKLDGASSTHAFSFNSGASFVPSEHDDNSKDTRRLSVCMSNITFSPLSERPTLEESAETGYFNDLKQNGSRHNSDVAICTAVSKNYLAFARTFVQSVRRIHPALRIFVLLVDQIGEGTFDPQKEPFEIILLEDLDNIPNPQNFYFKYTPIELNTAAKPFVYEYIFKKFGVKKLAYFDPDILVFDSLQPIWDLLESHNLVLTPHITAPYPDKLQPSAITILQAGAFNLGFIGMSNTPETHKFLRYWQDHLYDYCFMDIAKGMHVDQNWVDFAPCMFDDVYILKSPAYNAAYWNLHYTGAKIHAQNGKYFICTAPLVFFHFSGFKLNNLEGISVHQNRYTLSSLPNLRPLFEMYRDMLLANRHDEFLKWPYAYAVFDNGVKISPFLRKVYNENVTNVNNFGNPFSSRSSDSFFQFLIKPFADEDPRAPQYITQLIAIIYNVRNDLQELIPDIRGANRELFFKWLLTYGKNEYGLDLALIPGTPEFVSLLQGQYNQQISGRQYTVDALPKSTQMLNYGINFVGYFKGEFGVADAARSYVNAAHAVNIPYVLNNLHADAHSNKDVTYREYADTNPYSINLFSVNADQAYNVRHMKGAQFYEGHYNIASWFWELEKFPAKWQTSFKCYDEIWAATEFCRKSIAASSSIPVYTVPLAIEIDTSAISVDRSRFALPDGQFVFLFVFDYLSVFERKNPLAVISAFRQAFANGNDALLLIKTINSHHAPDNSALLRAAAAGCNVRFIDQHLDGVAMMSLMASVDCFVSLHRSEGFGLGMAQSMYLGKPVIATGYSGNMEFMTSRNSLTVDYQLVELSQDYGPYERGNVWADPNVDHAAYLMSSVYNDKTLVESIARKASSDIKNYFSPRAIGEKIKHRIDDISTQLKSNAAKSIY